jgi:hypothetical protein
VFAAIYILCHGLFEPLNWLHASVLRTDAFSASITRKMIKYNLPAGSNSVWAIGHVQLQKWWHINIATIHRMDTLLSCSASMLSSSAFPCRRTCLDNFCVSIRACNSCIKAGDPYHKFHHFLQAMSDQCALDAAGNLRDFNYPRYVFLLLFWLNHWHELGSAVAVERIFSGGHDAISLRRASLKPDTSEPWWSSNNAFDLLVMQ